MSKSKSEVLLPKRSKKLGVGKEIGGNVYLHRIYEELLDAAFAKAKTHLAADFAYTVVKLNLQTNGVTFTHSAEFDTADEPIVGKQILVREDGSTRFREQLADPYIYHHKWLFVADDYEGFDVEQSRTRSLAWLALDDVDKSRIGRASYWRENVVPRLEEAEADKWLRSEDIRRELGVSTCELSHLRNDGKLSYKKQGNAFLYRQDKELFKRIRRTGS